MIAFANNASQTHLSIPAPKAPGDQPSVPLNHPLFSDPLLLARLFQTPAPSYGKFLETWLHSPPPFGCERRPLTRR